MAGSSLGSFGEVVFQVSSDYVLTYEQLSRRSRAIYADHEVAGGKPASEYTGPDLDDVDIGMVFNATLGVSPKGQVATLRDMQASGEAHPLMIGSDSWGNFTIREVGQEITHSLDGEPLIAQVDVVLREYVENLPGGGSQAASLDASSRGVTGKGGPQKVAGAKPGMQQRSCTAKG